MNPFFAAFTQAPVSRSQEAVLQGPSSAEQSSVVPAHVPLEHVPTMVRVAVGAEGAVGACLRCLPSTGSQAPSAQASSRREQSFGSATEAPRQLSDSVQASPSSQGLIGRDRCFVQAALFVTHAEVAGASVIADTRRATADARGADVVCGAEEAVGAGHSGAGTALQPPVSSSQMPTIQPLSKSLQSGPAPTHCLLHSRLRCTAVHHRSPSPLPRRSSRKRRCSGHRRRQTGCRQRCSECQPWQAPWKHMSVVARVSIVAGVSES